VSKGYLIKQLIVVFDLGHPRRKVQFQNTWTLHT